MSDLLILGMVVERVGAEAGSSGCSPCSGDHLGHALRDR